MEILRALAHAKSSEIVDDVDDSDSDNDGGDGDEMISFCAEHYLMHLGSKKVSSYTGIRPKEIVIQLGIDSSHIS